MDITDTFISTLYSLLQIDKHLHYADARVVSDTLVSLTFPTKPGQDFKSGGH